MEHFDTLRHFLVDNGFSDTLCQTSLPCLKGFSGLIVSDKCLVRLIYPSFEPSAELQSANFLQVFKPWHFFGLEILLHYIVLTDSGSVFRGPYWDVNRRFFVVDEVL